MTEHIILAGSGGQGVMLLGKILVTAGMKEGKFVTWLPSYGAEVRGGTAYCMAVISDEEIGSPFIEKADTLIMMNAPSLKRFQDSLKNKGLLVLNSSLAATAVRKNMRILQYPFTDIALKLGNMRVANMVALGCFAAEKNIISLNNIHESISEFAPPDKKALIEINQKALEEGAKLKRINNGAC